MPSTVRPLMRRGSLTRPPISVALSICLSVYICQTITFESESLNVGSSFSHIPTGYTDQVRISRSSGQGQGYGSKNVENLMPIPAM